MDFKAEKEMIKEKSKLINTLKLLKFVISSLEEALTRLYSPASAKDYPVQLLNKLQSLQRHCKKQSNCLEN
ncbi:MAG: hypothetical protein FWF46_08410 [Oscillospiraceae bacterium]|nr:hypothetical protein [Oscillospiraceae bacterium]